jgi:hypothetical protein
MSNRIAAFQAADRVDFGAFAQPASRWNHLAAVAGRWLAPSARDEMALTSHLRHDLGLADQPTATVLWHMGARV